MSATRMGNEPWPVVRIFIGKDTWARCRIICLGNKNRKFLTVLVAHPGCLVPVLTDYANAVKLVNRTGVANEGEKMTRDRYVS